MSVQVRRRREAAAFLASFVGAQGELLVDTTNNRVQVHDGTTPGGWPAAKLAEATSAVAITGGAINGTPVGAKTPASGAFTSLSASASFALNLNAAAVPAPTGTSLFLAGSDGGNSFLSVSSYGGSAAFHSDILLQTARGTGAAPAALQSGDTIGQLQFRGYGASGFTASARAIIRANAAENWTDSANGTFMAFLTCATGTASPLERLRVDPAGNLMVNGGAQKIAAQDGSLYLPAYAMAALPAPGAPGRMVFSTNARMFNGAGTLEASGAGSGGLLVDNGTAWKIAGTNVTASA